MNYEKFLSENLKSDVGLNLNRGGMYGINQFQNYQPINKYPTPYQFPSPSGINPFLSNDDLALGGNNQGYGLKFANEPMYGHSGLETQSQYGPPMMQSKGGKLKGAALSALTLLAFLFFLNLLQSCLKDQMDSMNPTVTYNSVATELWRVVMLTNIFSGDGNVSRTENISPE